MTFQYTGLLYILSVIFSFIFVSGLISCCCKPLLSFTLHYINVHSKAGRQRASAITYKLTEFETTLLFTMQPRYNAHDGSQAKRAL